MHAHDQSPFYESATPPLQLQPSIRQGPPRKLQTDDTDGLSRQSHDKIQLGSASSDDQKMQTKARNGTMATRSAAISFSQKTQLTARPRSSDGMQSGKYFQKS